MFPLRLHWSSVLVGCVAALLLVLICVPGRVYQWFPGVASKHAHGWPFVYLKRETDDSSNIAPTPRSNRDSASLLPMAGIPWLSIDNWRFWEVRTLGQGARREFSLTLLAADVAYAILILVVTVSLFEFRRRRRPSAFSLTLPDLFVTLTVACCALGWFALEKNSFQREVAIQSTFEEQNYSIGVVEDCAAPTWARALIGDGWMPGFTWRAGEVMATADIARIPTLCDDMRAMPYSTKLQLYGGIIGDGHYPYARLNSIRQLNTLDISTNPRLDSRDVQELAGLRRLKKLVIAEGLATPDLMSELQSVLPGCTVIEGDSDL